MATFFYYFTCFKEELHIKLKLPLKKRGSFVWRRARDSNPRTCNSQRFSRPPRSTTLPALRRKNTV